MYPSTDSLDSLDSLKGFEITFQEFELTLDTYGIPHRFNDGGGMAQENRLEGMENPINWPTSRKLFIVMVGILAIFNSTLGSTLPTGAIQFIGQHFSISNSTELVLPISLYQMGLVIGATIFGPLSEIRGRRPVIIYPFAAYTAITLSSSFVPSWAYYLFSRLACGIFASSAVSVSAGLFADIFTDPVARGRAVAIFFATNLMGPQFGPLLSGVLAPIGWQWPTWLAAILGGLTFIVVLFIPETYAPVLLRQKEQRTELFTHNPAIPTQRSVQGGGFIKFITRSVFKPLHMLISEPLVTSSCLYLGFASGVSYLFFQAYPVIFHGVYGLNLILSGVAFLPVAFGNVVGFLVGLIYDHYLARAKRQKKLWADLEEYQRLPLACMGGPMCVLSLFWLGWSASAQIFWVVPALSGALFGVGFFLLVSGVLNYLTDSYKTASASAMAAITISRSAGSAGLSLIADPLYDKLGVRWATTLLAFIGLGLSAIPFVFIIYGPKIRARSKVYQQILKEQAL